MTDGLRPLSPDRVRAARVVARCHARLSRRHRRLARRRRAAAGRNALAALAAIYFFAVAGKALSVFSAF
jgi:hypothetical protein